MEIWFVRHAQSTVNAGMPSIYTETVELTDKGWQQAGEFAAKPTRKPDLITVTPFLRTQQTSQPTQRRFPDTPVVMLPLQEFMPISFANYAHKTTQERAPLAKTYWDKNDVDFVDGPGAESYAEMVRRIKISLQKLKEAPGDFKIAFTHGRILQTLRVMLAFPEMEIKELMRLSSEISRHTEIDNCAVFKTQLKNGRLQLDDQDQKFVEQMVVELKSLAKAPNFKPA